MSSKPALIVSITAFRLAIVQALVADAPHSRSAPSLLNDVAGLHPPNKARTTFNEALRELVQEGVIHANARSS